MKKILALFLVLMAVFTCGMGNTPGRTRISAASPLAKVHDFTLDALSGEKITLSSLKGYVILISFWAPWCPPCRQEMPSMQKLYEEIGNDKFEILAIAVKQNRAPVEKFIKENKYSFPVLLDEDGSVARKYRVSAIPTNIIIDKSGAIVFREGGAKRWDSKASIKMIKDLINE